jgi:hypothetical protein
MRATLLAAVFLVLMGAAADDPPRILFAVWTTHSATNPTQTYIEPIALLHPRAYGSEKIEYIKPPREKQLVDEYYKPGAKYDVVRGGIRSGSVTVRPADNNTCEPIERLAARSGTSTPHWRGADAVAGPSLALRKRSSPLRALSAEENRQFMTMIRRLFILKAVPADALDEIKSENVIATDLNGDGRIDFIGSFLVRDRLNTHVLFAVVMRDAGGALRADVIRYDRSLNAKDDMSAKNWTLVDVEDFDGDGIDEILVANHGWEWHSYDILRMKRDAAWEVIYSGGGSGC